MPATPIHHTATTDSAWDGPAQEKNLQTPLTEAVGDDVFAWRDPDKDLTTKSAWSYPHHEVDSDGKPGAANIKGCQSAIGYLNGAGGNGAGIPEKDRQAVYDHLATHLKDAKVDVPELKSAGPAGDKVPAVAVRAEYRNVPERRVAPRSTFELREVPNGTGGTNLRFTGFASVTCADHDDSSASYEMEDWLGPWTESIVAGAFRKTLMEGADVAFLLNHTGMTLARTKPGTLKLSEETNPFASPVAGVTGLHSEALLDPQNMYVQAMRSAVERGDLDEMSFAFRVLRQEWNADWDRRWITEVSLDKGDVSLVNYGANPHTGGTVSLRQRLGTRSGAGRYDRVVAMAVAADADGRRALGQLLKRTHGRDALEVATRAGKVLSAANVACVQAALDHLHAADDVDIPGIVRSLQDIDAALDGAMSSLSSMGGLPDPDGDPGDLEPTLVPPGEQKARLAPRTGLDKAQLALAKAKGRI